MPSLNHVVLIGNLTDDPELRFTQSGMARARFSVAVNRRWKDRDGNIKEEVTFVPIVVWGSQAENCVNFLSKGRSVAVEGRLRIHTFQTEEGERRKITEVVANNVQFLGSRRGEAPEAAESEPAATSTPTETNTSEGGEEEVPF